MRDLIFIGHANPEDNELTLWLRSKLINEGYDVECDLTCLTGGEDDYWKVLQDILENRACKYLLILSKNTFQKQGVIDEWEQVKSISKRHNLKDFVMVLKIDDVPFDVRIGLNVKNQFRFDESGAKALKKLIVKIDQDNVPKQRNTPLSINDWLKNKHTTLSGVVKKKEKFYSNWLSIPSLPPKLFFYKYSNDTQAQAILDEINDYPIVRHDVYLITFLSDLPIFSLKHQIEIKYTARFDVNANSAFHRFESNDFPNYDDLRRLLVRLLKNSFSKYLLKRDLNVYEMSQKTLCYYYKKDQLELNKVHFTYEGKKAWKLLIGEFHESFWHYGISFHPLLYPELCFSLRAHLVFSDDGLTIWNDKKKVHKARRSKGKNWFNPDWRHLLLAFIKSLSDDGSVIKLPLSEKNILQIPATTIQFYSDLGYEEPITNARIVPLDYYDDEEDHFDDEEEEDD